MPPIPVYEDALVTVSATLVNHGPVYPALAYRFDTARGSVVFSGDTGFPCDNLVALASGADVLVSEVIDTNFITTWFDDPAAYEAIINHLRTSHTPIEDVGAHAQQAGVRTLVLNHIVPGNTPVRRLREAGRGFSGQLIVGEDLMTIDIDRSRPPCEGHRRSRRESDER
jgi:ribonuclease BN (tRNA processing enzyme)